MARPGEVRLVNLTIYVPQELGERIKSAKLPRGTLSHWVQDQAFWYFAVQDAAERRRREALRRHAEAIAGRKGV
jgi:hypothetical protein